MKLVDILARELVEWPEGTDFIWQSSCDNELYFDSDTRPMWTKDNADDSGANGAKVTRAEWQAAVEAIKAEQAAELKRPDKLGSGLKEKALRFFNYNTETGVLTWRYNDQKRFIGREAGHLNRHGYVCVNLDRVRMHAHQIVWLIHHGVVPDCEIDHKNGIRDDNRIENLRLATQKQNQQNAGVRIDNILGIKGVRLRPSGKYQARVKLSDGSHAVKTFKNLNDAIGWLSIQREISHGEYANTPEGISLEDQHKSLMQICIDAGSAEITPAQLKVAEKLYQAGYRKQVSE